MPVNRLRRTGTDKSEDNFVSTRSLDTPFRCPPSPLRNKRPPTVESCPCMILRSPLDCSGDRDSITSNDAVMDEVADWLELNEQDTVGEAHRGQLRRVMPSIDQAVAHFAAYRDSSSVSSISPDASQALLRFVALHLLASCYTIIPGSSAESLPLLQQKVGPAMGSALRLHWRYRFSPATGHHARESSETSPWPGLYAGSTLEDRVAEAVSQRRQVERRKASQFVPGTCTSFGESIHRDQERSRETQASRTRLRLETAFEGSYRTGTWNDGPGPSEGAENQSMPHNRSRSSSSASAHEKGLFKSLTCKPHFTKTSKHKTHKTFFDHFSSTRKAAPIHRPHPPSPKRPTRPPRPSPTRLIRSHIPIALRRTQSLPRKPSADIPNSTPPIRRRSSSPTIPINRFQIPEIRRISATPAATLNGERTSDPDAISEIFTRQWCLDDTGLTPMRAWEKRREQSAASDVVSPLTIVRARLPGARTQKSDYFADVADSPLGEQVKPQAGIGENDVSSEDSDDSVGMLDKRKGGIFQAQDFGPESSPKLRALSEYGLEDGKIDDLAKALAEALGEKAL